MPINLLDVCSCFLHYWKIPNTSDICKRVIPFCKDCKKNNETIRNLITNFSYGVCRKYKNSLLLKNNREINSVVTSLENVAFTTFVKTEWEYSSVISKFCRGEASLNIRKKVGIISLFERNQNGANYITNKVSSWRLQ